jgi:hypothetical protein
MKYSSETEIFKALGMKDWAEYRLDSIKEIINNDSYSPQGKLLEIIGGRRSGRTTRMLVSALFVSQSAPVSILAHDFTYTEFLVKIARDYCLELGLETSNIHNAYLVRENKAADYVLLRDHYEAPSQDR